MNTSKLNSELTKLMKSFIKSEGYVDSGDLLKANMTTNNRKVSFCRNHYN